MKNNLLVKTALLFLTTVLILSGCGKTAAKPDDSALNAAPVSEEPQVQAEGSVPDPVAEVQAPVALSDDELQEFTELFDTLEYNGFLSDSFRDPTDINWDAVLRNGAGISLQDVIEEEVSIYLQATGQKKLYGDLYVIRKGDLANYIRYYTGADLMPAEDTLTWTYIGAHDSFYAERWADERGVYRCVSGEKEGDRYTLRFELSDSSPGIDPRSHRGVFADRILTLRNSGDHYIVESNAICWDDHADPEQTFDVELPQFDGPVRFITYEEYNGETSILLVRDGKRLTELSTYVWGDQLAYLKKVAAVGFFDFNADGMKDIAVIGDSDLGRRALLYEAVTGDYVFNSFADLDAAKMAELGADFTIDSLKAALLGSHGEGAYGSWQEAYAQIAKVYRISNDMFLYDLIQADGDDVPELVVDYPGYGTSLFTYENGSARCLMNHWPYGAGGNAGYSYLPGTGVYYNGNADYAGAVYYEYYMSKRDAGELGTDYWVKHINFNDFNGDGEPSEEELLAFREYVRSAEYHNETGREMTPDEVKAAVDLYDSYEMRPLSGAMDYDSLLAQLGV